METHHKHSQERQGIACVATSEKNVQSGRSMDKLYLTHCEGSRSFFEFCSAKCEEAMRKLYFILCCWLSLLAPFGVAVAADTVHVGIAGLSGNLIHPFVSKDAGIFQKHGIDARLVVFEGGSLLAQA